jgi:hypothetical protein
MGSSYANEKSSGARTRAVAACLFSSSSTFFRSLNLTARSTRVQFGRLPHQHPCRHEISK